MVSSESTVFLTFIAVAILLYRWSKKVSISHIPGPEPESFWLGNLPEIFQSQAGEPDFKYQRLYGDVVRVRGPFGEDRLLISDPKALQYIFHTSGYGFLKWSERKEISRVLMGRGLLWADGDIHKRQRKVMLPGFGAPEARAYVPIFQKTASELVGYWTDILASTKDQSAPINVSPWLSRTTMDAVGEAAFDIHFGALANSDNEFMKAYLGLMADTLGSPSKSTIFMQTILPIWVLQLMSKYSQRRNLVHARHTADLADVVTRELVSNKSDALLQGKGSKDIMSLLVKANASENADTRLTEEEMLAQMRTILLAGHETSATTMCWILLELARNQGVQDKLRVEIRAAEERLGRHSSEFTANDLENLPYLTAVIKESMRFHPALYQNYREAANDVVLPLSTPIKATTGEVIHELPIGKGTKVILSIAGYQRNREVFGEDADSFNPERWFRESEGKKGPTLGVYGNLLAFAGGARTCIGWRFAVHEVQALTVAIVNNFELSLTPDIRKLRREACLVMLPTLEGQQLEGENLPLNVKIAQRD